MGMLSKLRGELGADVVLDSDTVANRATSYWNQSPMQAEVLVRPQITADLSSALKLCLAAGRSVVIHGDLDVPPLLSSARV